jgi:ubiquinone biosynthesis accessory factor UbiK
MLIDAKTLDQFVAAVTRFLPTQPSDVKKNLRAVLQSVFDRMDLVTREELEVQEAVLARTRERLQQMEQRVAELESQLRNK